MAALSACGVAPARDESGAAAAPPSAPVERSNGRSAVSTDGTPAPWDAAFDQQARDLFGLTTGTDPPKGSLYCRLSDIL